VKIDAHHHFWKYHPAEYGWIGDAMACLRRDFLPADLQEEMRAAGIDGAISVQARQSLDETRWLLELADKHDWIKGVVGWLPLADPNCELPAHPKLKGVRHVVQAEPHGFLDDEAFHRGIARLNGLVYDILIVERQLPEAIRFVDRHPNQVFVLDHIAKPKIKSNELAPWRENIRELARRANVFCKVSGLVTEADYRQWTEAQLRPYFDVVLEAFGPRRLMFGSDWPVCLVACEYGRWARIVAGLSQSEQAHIMGCTATAVYQLR
jgi:L-fuconolactonase